MPSFLSVSSQSQYQLITMWTFSQVRKSSYKTRKHYRSTSTAVAVCETRGVSAGVGGCLPGGVFPGDVAQGVSAQGVGGVCPEWGVSAQGGCLAGGVCEQNDWQTDVKTLPCHNFVADGNYVADYQRLKWLWEKTFYLWSWRCRCLFTERRFVL